MKLILLTALTMVAFAANSLLNRFALLQTDMGAADFTLLRLASGALVLAGLVWLKDRALPKGSVKAALSLFAYMAGFSLAYVTLPTGTGALILFGGVQLTMFAGSSLMGATPPPLKWLGAGIGLAGLGVLFLPGASTPEPLGAALMGIAALGWGIYSLLGRGVTNPLQATAGNFVWATPLALLLWFAMGQGAPLEGVLLAVVSGALASGLGYALWYAVLPRLSGAQAATSQLSVPILAALAGWALLSEPLGPQFMLAMVLVLGGMAITIFTKER